MSAAPDAVTAVAELRVELARLRDELARVARRALEAEQRAYQVETQLGPGCGLCRNLVTKE